MLCPQCGAEWDISKSSCPRCGFDVQKNISSEKTTLPQGVRRNASLSGNLAQSQQPDRLAASENRQAIPPLSRRQPGGLPEIGSSSVSIPPRPERLNRGVAGSARPVSQPLTNAARTGAGQPGTDTNNSSASLSSTGRTAGASISRPLLPGAPLRSGRYRIQELAERQNWFTGAFEATWIGRDAQSDRQVTICEVVIPDSSSPKIQMLLRNAALALKSINRHPHITPLIDVFTEQQRAFFVSEMVEGENLLARLRRTQRPLAEKDVLEFCLQMTDTLEFLSQRSPTLVHGLIRPEHIYSVQNSTQYVLSNFSILVAGGTPQIFVGTNRAHLSPYTDPEFARGIVDTRTDLYAVMATAYHLITGNAPVASAGVIPHARQMNALISSSFDALLARGLHFAPHQRYQRPSQLRQDLLGLRSGISQPDAPVRFGAAASEGHYPLSVSPPVASAPPASSYIPLPIQPTFLAEEEEERSVLPRPEDLEPMNMGNDQLVAAALFTAMLLGTTLTVILGHLPG